ncbi:HAD family hydrolase [Streptomyces sp. enrichment culture]|uniref:HAD family hydrolase n=1 Tax=Streptomyces sp. enrichment culture TaxID=1795815 RepID=UPI003F556724
MTSTLPAVGDRARGTALLDLLAGTEAVLLDFDGPVCDLFGPVPTAHVAAEIKAMARGHWGRLHREVEDCHDSHGILPRLGDMADKHRADGLSREPLRRAHAIVTGYEYDAVRTARPTPLAGELLRQFRRLRLPVVVVTNNAAGPVRAHLEREGLTGLVADVCGRDADEPRRMKPDPYLVDCALALLGGPDPSRVLLIGDQLTDLEAARRAGVRFLGCTADPDKRRRMAELGADGVVGSHAPVMDAARRLPAP